MDRGGERRKSMFKNKTLERREFLKGAAAAGGAVALGMVAGGAMANTEPPSREQATADAAKSQGYHLTQHIRDYYNSTRS